MIHWAFSQPTIQEQAFATAALGHAMAYGTAQKSGESQRGTIYYGGPLVMLATMREMIEGIWEVVR